MVVISVCLHGLSFLHAAVFQPYVLQFLVAYWYVGMKGHVDDPVELMWGPVHFGDSGEEKAGFPSRWTRREQFAFEMKVIQMQSQKGFTLYQEDPVM